MLLILLLLACGCGGGGSGADTSLDARHPVPAPPESPPKDKPFKDPKRNPPDEPPPLGGSGAFPVQHYPHIRVHMSAYAGWTPTAFEDNLLRNSVDFVQPNGSYLAYVEGLAPDVPQVVYGNVSNTYLDGGLEDWLEYADKNGHDREELFFHASGPTSWSGAGGSTQPVTWFHSVLQGGASFTNLTSNARWPGDGWNLPNTTGDFCAVGYFEKFREIQVDLSAAGASGWNYVVEYPTAVDAAKAPTQWATLTLLSDGTNGLNADGLLEFDPPTNWKPCKIGGSPYFFFVRFRCTSTGTPPTIQTFFGRNWSGAGATAAGTLQAFDAAADGNGDGYLNASEYALRASGKDARFRYESRLFTTYGEMRFVVRPAPDPVRAFYGDYMKRWLDTLPLANGFMADNSSGKTGLCSTTPASVESTDTFAQDYAGLLVSVTGSISPRIILANTTGSDQANPIVAAGIHYYEEFVLRPMSSTWKRFADSAAIVSQRISAAAQAPETPMGVLDILSDGGARGDPRTMIAGLANFYVVADPSHQFIEFWGGEDPAGSWTTHWCNAIAHDVGVPTSGFSEFATGSDPENANYVYKVYRRDYSKAVVLYKPLSFFDWSNPVGSTRDATATTHSLGGSYRPLLADGTLGAPVTSISLRNGEGAILVPL